MSTGSRSSPGSADGAPLRSSSCRSARPNTTRSRHSMPAQTTTSPSRSGWPSSSPGCAPPSDAPGPRRHPRGPRAAGRSPHPGCLRGPQRRAAKGPHGRLRDRSAAKQATPDGDEIRLTPTEWGIVEALVRNEGRLVTQQRLLNRVGTSIPPGDEIPAGPHGPQPPQVGARSLHPRYFHTEPGMGYRFTAQTTDGNSTD
jgi:hypothetical protein